MQDTIQYLIKKLERSWSNNRGVRLLLDNQKVEQELLETYLFESLGILLHHLKKGDADARAQANLTAVSSAIGLNIIDQWNIEDVWEDHLSLGDLILESMFQLEYIHIEREHAGNSAPYIVQHGKRWDKLKELTDEEIEKIWKKRTVYEPIPLIDDLYQGHGKPIIKHWRRNKCDQFRGYLTQPFVRSLDKQQRTGWRVNNDILEAVLNSKDALVSESVEVHDSDGTVLSYDIYENNDHLPDKLYWVRAGKSRVFRPELADWAKRKEKDAHHKWRRYINKNKKKMTKEELESSEDFVELRNKIDSYGKLFDRYREAEKEVEKLKSKSDVYTFVTREALIKKDKVFYQYLDTDYRGRCYYMQSFLNYQSNDVARGMLEFSEGKKLDGSGLRHLMIHMANCYNETFKITNLPTWLESNYQSHLEKEQLETISVDKLTLNDKVNWCMNNIELLLNTANDKVVHENAEKPVIFLACCIDLNNYTTQGPDYVSHLPVPIDGSNNGWQHLAAISKDEQAGELVGLIPCEIQKDFYVKTAKRLHKLVPEGRLKDLLGEMPMKDIRKGISKRGSMTRAYSAGVYAIATNMYEDCRVEGFDIKYGIRKSHCNDLAFYLTKAIDQVCPGPLDTMDFLQRIAAAGIEGEGDFLSWTTPSGFPVEYKAFKFLKLKHKGSIKGIGRIEHVTQQPTEEPDMKKYNSGISPNFVHSQDAAHMALLIDQWDGAFAGVHDSFSTHACDVERLKDLTKETFIEIYNQEDYFQKILDLFDVDVGKPDQGQLNLQDIRKSDYFFA